MKSENFKKFKKAIKDMENSKGYKLDSSAYELENSFITMVYNFAELEQVCNNVPVFTVEQKRNGKSRKFLINVLRVFSNYLTSVTAFTSHTRNFIKKNYGETNNAFDGKYQREIDKKFKNNELSQFIEDLRNFYQHYAPLPIGIVSKVNSDKKFYSILIIAKEEIKKSDYKKWSKLGKKIIEQNNNIDMFQISKDYLYKTIFPWVMQQQSKYHKKEFKELKRLQKIAKFFYNN